MSVAFAWDHVILGFTWADIDENCERLSKLEKIPISVIIAFRLLWFYYGLYDDEYIHVIHGE